MIKCDSCEKAYFPPLVFNSDKIGGTYIGTATNSGNISVDAVDSCTTASSTYVLKQPEYYAPDVITVDRIPYESMYSNAEAILNSIREGKKMGTTDKKKDEVKQYDGMYYPKRIVFNPPATIVFWKDGTKTVVKCSEGEPFSEYAGFCAALTKKIFGHNNQIVRLVKNGERQGTPDEYAYAICKVEKANKEPEKKPAPKKAPVKKPVAKKGTTSCKNK